MRPDWDVVVVGGGPAGCAAALALDRRGVKRVCLVAPRSAASRVPVGESVPGHVRPLLESLGCWDAFEADGHEPCLGSCASWGDASLGFNDFVFDPQGPGWHLDRSIFDSTLMAQASARVAFVDGRAAGAGGSADGAAVLSGASPSGGFSMTTRYLIDASGSRGMIARRMGARRRVLDRLTCFYAFFDASDGTSMSQLTLAEATVDGWWYTAAVPGRKRAVAFATDPDIARRIRLDDPNRWFAHMMATTHLAPRLDGCRFLRDSLIVRAAPTSCLERTTGRNWLAVGDAAASYDPMSAQGIHKAMDDGLRAAEILTAALDHGGDLTTAYDSEAQSAFEDHRISRRHFYSLERRWPEAPFWKRRGSASPADPLELP